MPTSPPVTPLPSPKDYIAGLDKGLAVLQTFNERRPRLAVTEVAQRAGITRTAARRYLLTLAHLGFIESDGRYYWLTPRVLRLGECYFSSSPLPRLVKPTLEWLAQQAQETAAIGVLDDTDVIFIASSTPPTRVYSGLIVPGKRLPAHCTATGRAIASEMSLEHLQAWLARQDLRALTPQTQVDRQAVRSAVQSARTLGYALVDQEMRLNVRSIAVPVRTRTDQVVAALSLSVQAPLSTSASMTQHLLPLLLEAQQRLRGLI